MGLIVKVEGQADQKLRVYKFPSKGTQPEDYSLIVNGETLDSTRVRTTAGGGKSYTYIKLADQDSGPDAYWLTGALESGTEVTIEEEPVKDVPPLAATPAPATPAPAPKAAVAKPVPAPKAAPAKAPQRPPVAKKGK